jgi:hypothetical protein
VHGRRNTAGGGEGTIALAPNGSLILNSRGSAEPGGRFQSESRDGGVHWSTPRTLEGYGSSAEGAMIRMNNSDQMLFSHSGNVNGTGGRYAPPPHAHTHTHKHTHTYTHTHTHARARAHTHTSLSIPSLNHTHLHTPPTLGGI